MTNQKLTKRLQNLFSALQPDCQPVQPPETVPPRLEAAPANSTPPVSEPPDENPPDSDPRGPVSPGLEDAPVLRPPSASGWDDFLDGIRRDETMLVEYGSAPPTAGMDGDRGEAALSAPLEARIDLGGDTVGTLRLQPGPEHPFSPEDRALVEAVTQQLTQQMETLRLLDEARRSRSEAEQAYHRLTRQNTATTEVQAAEGPAAQVGRFETTLQQARAFHYGAEDEPTVGQSAGPANGTNGGPGVLKATIREGERAAGELVVEDPKALVEDEAGVVEAVAQRLSQQVENLRLLEESRHFRAEAEAAIRKLTYQNWQAFLESTAKERLGFQYNRSQVQPFDVDLKPLGASFPLKVREETIGELALKAPGVQHLDTRDLIDTITERLSAHLESLRLAEQREQALAETEALYSISARLSTAQSIEEALSTLSIPASEAGASDSRLFFVSYDEAGQIEGIALAAIWYPDEGAQLIPVQSHFMLADYPAYRLALQDPDSPVLIENVETDDQLEEDARSLLVRSGARAAAILPLAYNRRWVGSVFVHWEQPHVFSSQEKRLYSALSRQAAVVVNNRLLLEQTRKRAQEMQTVAQVSTAASTILRPQDLLQTVVDLTKSSFSLYHVQVYLYRPVERILEVTAGSGEIGRIIAAQKQYEVWESLSPVARAARERQVVIHSDTASDQNYKHNAFLPNVRSEMVIPMVVGDRLLGVFDVQSDQAARFSREDARTYTTLAAQVAVALQNAELYAEQTATVKRLRELDHLKSSFLANMSHELRTPLNSILGFAEVLLLRLDGPLTELMDNDIHLIEKNGKHLLSLINDVLDMAKIEAGRMNLSYEDFTLRELLNDSIDITGSLAREKGLYLRVDPESEDQFTMSADRVRIRQVMINAISNAIKFTEKGGVSICARRDGDWVRITVRDTGLGIPKDMLEMIFEEFSQVNTSTTRKVGGTGLGLPISRRLVEMHGGRMWAESEGIPGMGSLFQIELPLEAAPVNA